MADLLPLRVVMVRELRLLGRGPVRAAAVADLADLPHDGWQSRVLLSVVGRSGIGRTQHAPAGRAEETLMKDALQWYENKARELRAEGETRAKAEDVLAVLAARGLEVPEAVRERVQGCTDLAQLDAWHTRAVTVERAEDIFEAG